MASENALPTPLPTSTRKLLDVTGKFEHRQLSHHLIDRQAAAYYQSIDVNGRVFYMCNQPAGRLGSRIGFCR